MEVFSYLNRLILIQNLFLHSSVSCRRKSPQGISFFSLRDDIHIQVAKSLI